MGHCGTRDAHRQAHAGPAAGACALGCGGDWLRVRPGRDLAVKGMERHPDPGLQPERTTMAWTRTLVSFLVVAGASLRVSASVHDAAFIVIAVIAMTVALNIMVRQSGRYRRSNAGLVQEKVKPQVLSVMVMSAAVALLALVLLAMKFI